MKKAAVILLVMVFSLAAVAVAVEKEDAAHRAVKGTMQTIGEAAKGTVEAATSPIRVVAEGHPEKVVTEPVVESGRTVYDASRNTAETVTGQNE
jgi:hypothetical protein